MRAGSLPMLAPGALEAAERQACEDVIRQHSKSFYLSAKLLPPQVREAAFAIYAFCRHADDAVDEADGLDDPLWVVERLRLRLARVYRGSPLDTPVDRAFTRVIEAYGIPSGVPEALLAGMEMDARGLRYGTESELLLYAFRVASTVGLMMTRVMGPSSPAAYLRAADLGVAMQLTNICRDVGEDARAGRFYLPAHLCREEGLNLDTLATATAASDASKAVVWRLLATADAHYRAADAGIGYLPRDCRLAIASSRYIYAAIGEALARQGHDAITRRAFVTLPRKLALVGRAWRRIDHPADPTRVGPADAQLAGWIRATGLPAEEAA